MGIQSQIILDSPATSWEDARERSLFTAPKLENAYVEIEGKRGKFLEFLEPLMQRAVQ